MDSISVSNTRTDVDQEIIPNGFENINNDYSGIADIYFNNKTITSEDIEFEDYNDSIRISNSGVDQVINIVKKELNSEGLIAFKTFLNTPILANSTQTSQYSAISTQNITAYYNMENISLYIFVPGKYLLEYKPSYKFPRFHQKPTYDFKNTTFNTNIEVFKYKEFNGNYLYWNTSGNISNANISIQYSANSNVNNNFNRLYLQYIGEKYIYRLGYQESLNLIGMVNDSNYTGFSISQDAQLINGKYKQAYSSPFFIYLSQAALVKITYRGKILYNSTLLQGNNIIDTTKFPIGTYRVNIEVQNLVTGKITLKQQEYGKSPGLYSALYSGFMFGVGVSSQTILNNISLKDNNNQRDYYITLKNGINLLNGDLEGMYTYFDEVNYLGLSYNYLSDHSFNYQFSVNTSHTKNHYFNTNLSYKINHYSMLNLFISNSYSSQKKRYNASYTGRFSYTQGKWRLLSSMTSNNDDGYNFSNATISRSILLSDGFSKNISLSVGHSRQSGYEFGISFSLSFNDQLTQEQAIFANVNVDYQAPQGGISMGSLARYKYQDSYIQQTSNIDFTQKNSNILIESLYRSSMLDVSLQKSVSINDNKTTINNIGYGISTNIIATPNSLSFLSDKNNLDNGYLIKIPDTKENMKFEINNNKYNANQSVYISTPPYKYSNININILSEKYKLSTEEEYNFIYPNNIFVISPEIIPICDVNFILKTKDSDLYTLNDSEDIIILSNDKTNIRVENGSKLILKNIENGKICDLKTQVSCNNSLIQNLNEITCQ